MSNVRNASNAKICNTCFGRCAGRCINCGEDGICNGLSCQECAVKIANDGNCAVCGKSAPALTDAKCAKWCYECSFNKLCVHCNKKLWLTDEPKVGRFKDLPRDVVWLIFRQLIYSYCASYYALTPDSTFFDSGKTFSFTHSLKTFVENLALISRQCLALVRIKCYRNENGFLFIKNSFVSWSFSTMGCFKDLPKDVVTYLMTFDLDFANTLSRTSKRQHDCFMTCIVSSPHMMQSAVS